MNLTPTQRELLVKVMDLVRTGELKESFIAHRDGEGGMFLRNLVGEGGFAISDTTPQQFQALGNAGLLIVEIENSKFGLMNCTITGEAYAAVSSSPNTVDVIQQAATTSGRREVAVDAHHSRAIIDPKRIEELKELQSTRFDFRKLIRMCEELNVAFATESYFAVAMLTRAILDHVPPIFDVRKFAEVANNYAGSRSFKASMRVLEESSRNIADQHLHGQIRPAETIPTATQVNFSNDLDVLLGEIVRITRLP